MLKGVGGRSCCSLFGGTVWMVFVDGDVVVATGPPLMR